MTGPVLRMKSCGVNGGTCSCVDSSNLAMMGAIKNAKLPNFKGAVAYSGPTDNVFANRPPPRRRRATTSARSETLIIDQTNPAMQTWKANMTKYIPNYKGSFPTYGVTGGYISADLMIQMLMQAGQNPTRKGMMSRHPGQHARLRRRGHPRLSRSTSRWTSSPRPPRTRSASTTRP